MRTKLAEEDILAAALALSVPRLSNYKRFFSVTSESEAYGIHRWNEALSSLLFKCVSLTEIVMRNRIHEVMSLNYGVMGWPGSRDWFNHLNLTTISLNKIRDVTHENRKGKWIPRVPAPSPDDIISRQTFGFWTNLFEVKSEVTSKPINWAAHFPKIFHGHRQTSPAYWGLSQRDAVLARLKTCNTLRNRIAHHEPLWKWGPLMEEKMPRKNSVKPLALAPPPSTPVEAIDRLTLMHERVVELLGWCSPALQRSYLNTEAYAQFLSVNSVAGLDYYQTHSCSKEIDLNRFRLLSKLKKELRTARKKRGLLLIK